MPKLMARPSTREQAIERTEARLASLPAKERQFLREIWGRGEFEVGHPGHEIGKYWEEERNALKQLKGESHEDT